MAADRGHRWPNSCLLLATLLAILDQKIPLHKVHDRLIPLWQQKPCIFERLHTSFRKSIPVLLLPLYDSILGASWADLEVTNDLVYYYFYAPDVWCWGDCVVLSFLPLE